MGHASGVSTGSVTVEAAGAVLWRGVGDGLEVAVVHRPKYDDWSLPKGKLTAGEHPLLGALREVAEETGHRARPGRPLGEVRYPVAGEPKRVRYWAAQATGGGFAPNREVDELRWLPPARARRLLDADRDRGVLDTFLGGPVVTTPLLVVRHASAGTRGAWSGDDRSRPLDERGHRQAAALAALLSAYAVEVAVAADYLRCRQTLEPFLAATGGELTVDARLGVDAPDVEVGVRALVDLAAGRRPAVACSQREVIPRLLAGACSRLGLPTRADEIGQMPRASLVVLHVTGGDTVVAREWLPAPG